LRQKRLGSEVQLPRDRFRRSAKRWRHPGAEVHSRVDDDLSKLIFYTSEASGARILHAMRDVHIGGKLALYQQGLKP
jgi:hypothetical protein